jgi:hypothetical protein
MGLPLSLHIFIHILFAFLAGIFVWRIWKKPFASFIFAFIGGVLIDLDHFIDYFLAYGVNFNLFYFIKGFEFLKTDKLYVLFHGWEYVLVSLAITLILKNKYAKSISLAFAVALFFHLSSDVILDKVPPKSYSVVFRAKNNFDLQKLSYPEHWEKHLKYKRIYGFE